MSQTTDSAYNDRQKARIQKVATTASYACGSIGQHRRLMRAMKLRQAAS